MSLKTNYHTHSFFCDGAEEPEAYIVEAIEKGFTHLGFSGHAPVPFENRFAIKEEKLGEYCQTIHQLTTKYKSQIKIFLGLEADYIPDVTKSFSSLKKDYEIDYIIGSVHLVKPEDRNDNAWFIDGSKIEMYDEGLQEFFDGDIQKAVKTFFDQTNQMILNEKPDVIGHFDKIKMNNKERFFSEKDLWYQNLLMETMNLIKQENCICEINSRGIYKNRYPDYYPSQSLWKELQKRDIPIMIATDAHNPKELNLLYGETVELLQDTGFSEVSYFDNGWKTTVLE